MSRLAHTLILLLAGCPEYNLQGPEAKPDDPIDSDPPPVDTEPPVDTQDTQPPPDEEECNGEDDDGDGLVDEGFEDSDGDGVADCVDDNCDVDEHPGGEVEVLEACTGDVPPVVSDPWNVTIEWQYRTSGSGVIVMPAVGNLTDDNGDGLINDNDDPDIAFTEWSTGELIVLHGDGSGVVFQKSGFNGNAGVTIADVDVDGVPEVIALTSSGAVAALDGTGTTEWTSSPSLNLGYYPQPAVADLDADGDVEVVFDRAVLAGVDGSTLFLLSGISTSWRTPVLADIDADGTQEIILGEKVFDHTGALEWTTSSAGSGNFSAVADVDGDVGGEVFFLTGSKMYIHEPDGTVITDVGIPGSNPGPPAVADFDGDGAVEIAVPANRSISVWDVGGTMIWTATISDSSGLAGCSGYDIDGDGAYELLYADENMFRIFDGATGTLLYSNSSHSSGTLWEYPVTADVDRDGSAEIVIASNSGAWNGITVFGHSGSGWQASGPTWGTHDFAVTNLDADGSVPSPAPLSWTVHNVFRARPMVDAGGSADLYIFLEDMCVANCEEGPAKLSFGVANQGGLDVAAGVSVALYALDSGSELLVDTLYLDEVPSGAVIAGGTFELHPDDWGPDGVLLRVDDDGAGVGIITECDEDNNDYEYADGICG